MPSRSQEPRVAGWGRQFVPGRELYSEDLERASEGAHLLRGLGRSYGDASLPAPGCRDVLNTTLADRVLRLTDDGVLRAEAGLSLRALNRLTLHRGLFVPVTPGTQFVTLGGMVASDVHGKRHHVAGTIGRHVRALRMRVADGRVVECSPETHADLFWATIGGMGLTGAILEVELQLERIPSPWIYQEMTKHGDLDSLLAALEEGSRNWPMTVAWIDCVTRGRAMGRGILFVGRWAEAHEAPSEPPRWGEASIPVPFEAPNWAISPPTVRAFNTAYFHKQLRSKVQGFVSPETFFYPLDVIADWNLGYGSSGLTQHQAVMPRQAGPQGVRALLERLTALSAASPLCVLKDCGEQGQGLLSFPRPGTSIAIDMPVRSGTAAAVAQLNEVVIQHGGRIYLTKDQFTTAADFRAMEPRLDDFMHVRRRWDPELRFRSAQSVRLFGDPPFATGT